MNSLKRFMNQNAAFYHTCHLLNSQNINSFVSKSTTKHFSMSTENKIKSSYSVEEIQIPNGHQYGYKIACKVWKWIDIAASSMGEPPIVCVHGWLDNANSWDALLPKLMRPGRTFYAFDLPGHGFSSHIHTTHYNIHVESHLSIHRVVRYLELNKVTLMGHSMGAEASLMYAACFPEGVHKVITIDGVNPNVPNWVQSTKFFVTGLFEVEDVLKKSPDAAPKTYDELLGRLINARIGMVSEEGCRILMGRSVVKVPKSDDLYKFSHDLKLRLLPGMAMLTTEQMIEFCSTVTAPMCVIRAKDSGDFSRPASATFQYAMEAAKSQNQDLNVEFHVADGGHHLHLNEPDNVSDIILKFLDA